MNKDTQKKLWDGSFRVTKLGRYDGEEFNLNDPVEYRAKCLRLALNSGEWQDKADKWIITIGKEIFEYYTGTGLRKDNKPVKPSLGDVLHSLSLDSEACSISFDEWCLNFDYDNDSIKARGIYDACQKNGDKLNKAGVCMNAELREFLSEY